nr:MAG TPA: hypothetical protein [Caudoviricetes sp.]
MRLKSDGQKKPASTAMLTSYRVEVEPLHL